MVRFFRIIAVRPSIRPSKFSICLILLQILSFFILQSHDVCFANCQSYLHVCPRVSTFNMARQKYACPCKMRSRKVCITPECKRKNGLLLLSVCVTSLHDASLKNIDLAFPRTPVSRKSESPPPHTHANLMFKYAREGRAQSRWGSW